jgi:hypothetical protein
MSNNIGRESMALQVLRIPELGAAVFGYLDARSCRAAALTCRSLAVIALVTLWQVITERAAEWPPRYAGLDYGRLVRHLLLRGATLGHEFRGWRFPLLRTLTVTRLREFCLRPAFAAQLLRRCGNMLVDIGVHHDFGRAAAPLKHLSDRPDTAMPYGLLRDISQRSGLGRLVLHAVVDADSFERVSSAVGRNMFTQLRSLEIVLTAEAAAVLARLAPPSLRSLSAMIHSAAVDGVLSTFARLPQLLELRVHYDCSALLPARELLAVTALEQLRTLAISGFDGFALGGFTDDHCFEFARRLGHLRYLYLGFLMGGVGPTSFRYFGTLCRQLEWMRFPGRSSIYSFNTVAIPMFPSLRILRLPLLVEYVDEDNVL